MHWLGACLSILLALAPLGAIAQEWPSKPVKIIVPYPPAGAADTVARVVADKLSKALGQSFIVENKPGAAGIIGLELAARSAPDGYTLAVLPDIVSSAPHIYKLTFDPVKDLVPVVQLTQQPIVLSAHPSLGVATLAELTALAKAKPGLGFATSGIGTGQHMLGAWFAKLAGIELNHIPYKGGGQAITDHVAGQVPLASLGSSPLLPHHAAGNLRLLAQSTKGRAPTLKTVPTFQELGFTDILLVQWFGLVVPAGTPLAIVERLNLETNTLLRDADTLERLEKGALEAVGGTTADFAKLVVRDFEKYGRLFKELNIKVEQ